MAIRRRVCLPGRHQLVYDRGNSEVPVLSETLAIALATVGTLYHLPANESSQNQGRFRSSERGVAIISRAPRRRCYRGCVHCDRIEPKMATPLRRTRRHSGQVGGQQLDWKVRTGHRSDERPPPGRRNKDSTGEELSKTHAITLLRRALRLARPESHRDAQELECGLANLAHDFALRFAPG